MFLNLHVLKNEKDYINQISGFNNNQNLRTTKSLKTYNW